MPASRARSILTSAAIAAALGGCAGAVVALLAHTHGWGYWLHTAAMSIAGALAASIAILYHRTHKPPH